MGADRRSTIQRLSLRIHVLRRPLTWDVIASSSSLSSVQHSRYIQRTWNTRSCCVDGPGRRVAGRTDGHPKSQRAGGQMALGPLDGHPTNQPTKQTNKRRGFMALQHSAMRHVHSRVLASWIVLMHVLLCRLHMYICGWFC